MIARPPRIIPSLDMFGLTRTKQEPLDALIVAVVDLCLSSSSRSDTYRYRRGISPGLLYFNNSEVHQRTIIPLLFLLYSPLGIQEAKQSAR